MNILHCITSLNIGGAETTLFKLIKSDYKNNHFIISLKKNGFYTKKLNKLSHVRILEIEIKNPILLIYNIYKTISTIRNFKPDVIQSWLYHADFYIGIIGRLLGYKNIYWNIRNADLKNDYQSFSLKILIKLNALLSFVIPKKIFINSQSGYNFHKSIKYNYKIFTIIYNGYDFKSLQENFLLRKEFRENEFIADDEFVIGMVSRWHPQKDFLTLFKALELFKRKKTKWKLILIGENISNKNKLLIKQLKENNIIENTKLLETTENMSIIYNGMDVHISTSFGEGFPNVVLEALATKIISISTNTGDSSNILNDDFLLFEKEDYKAIYKKLLFLYEKNNYNYVKNKIVSQSIKRIKNDFSLENMCQKYNFHWKVN